MSLLLALLVYGVLFFVSQAVARQIGFPLGTGRPTLAGLVLPAIAFIFIWFWISVFFWGVSA
jgi:hypothetical protein